LLIKPVHLQPVLPLRFFATSASSGCTSAGWWFCSIEKYRRCKLSASLYGVKRIALRQQVARNGDRFPEDFMSEV
jgi:hypothetical protein